MISEQRQYSKSGLSQIFVFEYDKNNRLISKDYFNSSHKTSNEIKIYQHLKQQG